MTLLRFNDKEDIRHLSCGASRGHWSSFGVRACRQSRRAGLTGLQHPAPHATDTWEGDFHYFFNDEIWLWRFKYIRKQLFF
ncbi:MAG: hypothetical protein Q4G70_00160 [Pseudomonadota bacterium]|nr:hypothetical protein [Pseudomonadota bacterium]